MKNYLTFGKITSAIAISVTAITLTGCSLTQLPTISTDQIYSSLRNKDNTTNVEPADNDSDKDEIEQTTTKLVMSKQTIYRGENVYSLAEFEHDENGYIISNTRYDGDGNLDSTTKYENDRNGNVILESEYDADGNLTFEIKYEYNSHNDITKMEVNYKSGSYTSTNTVIYEYDGKELSKTTTYDESDNVLYYTVYTYPDKTTCEQTTYYDTFESYNVSTYDKSGNITKVVYYDEDGNEESE